MPTSTLTPGDEKQDEKLNPGQQDADRRFSDLSGAEKRGTANMDDFEDSLKNQEADSSAPSTAADYASKQEAASAPNSNWTNNVSGGQTKSGGRFKGWFKKAGPALGAGGIIGVGGFAMIALTSPSLLIVQMKEMMTGKFNTQLSSMQTRSNKLLIAKINGTTSGFCSSSVTIRCKYTSMSTKQINKFKTAGIEVVPKDNTTLLGRTKPDSFKFKGETISASEFASRANTDAEFRSALKQAYNPKYAGFVGKAWTNVANRFKISKQAPELNANEGAEEGRENLNQLAREGTDDDVGATRINADDEACEGPQCVSTDDANTVNSNAEAIEQASSNNTAANEVRSKLSGLNSGAATSVFKATGAIDTTCQVYGALTALSYAGKAIRSAQLVRYAMIFLGVADTIKAGESPDPEDVALLGTVLTTTMKDSSGNTLIGSATDSFGYKYAAFGDVSASSKSMTIASRFTSGSGLGGDLSKITSSVTGVLGGRAGAKSTCKTLANPFVQGGSLVLGVAMLFIPGVNAAKVAGQITLSAGMSLAIAVLPSMLADTIAGTVTNDIVGEESGNAITSGSGALLSDALAGQNGNAPMTKGDAIAYNELQTETLNQYIADEVRDTSPFDATNPHTFVGSIVSNLLPLQSSSNPLTTIGSLLSNSMSNIIPSSNAVSQANYSESLDVCQDLDVLESGYAADPFCNTIRGIPPKYLDKDPVVVASELIASGAITESGVPQGEYTTFINSCITAEEPLGYADATTGFDAGEADKCIINDGNANYYLFHMDKIIDSGFDGDFGGAEEATPIVTGSLPNGTAPELAQTILSSGKVTDRTGQLQQIISGSRTNVSTGILQVLAGLSSSNTFTISSLKRDQALGIGAGNKSLHLQGKAVDLSASSGINGVSFGFNGHDPTIQAFLDSAAAIMPENCNIGVPNQAYVNATKPKVKNGCTVFIDAGKGVQPHIHLDVKGDG